MNTEGREDGKIMRQEGAQELKKATRKTIPFKDSLDPSVFEAREGSFKVPEGQNGFPPEEVHVGLGSANGI